MNRSSTKSSTPEMTIYVLSTMSGYLHDRTSTIEGVKHKWVEGTIHTTHGIVSIYCQYGDHAYTTMTFVHNSKVFICRYECGYSKRYLRTLANKFADEVVSCS